MEQQAQIDEWEREQSTCRVHGGPREQCEDPERPWYPQRRVCYASMEKAAVEWRYAQLHDAAPFHDGTFPTDPDRWSASRTKDFPYHYRDGVTLWVAEVDLTPHDHFLGGAENCDECQEVAGGNTP